MLLSKSLHSSELTGPESFTEKSLFFCARGLHANDKNPAQDRWAEYKLGGDFLSSLDNGYECLSKSKTIYISVTSSIFFHKQSATLPLTEYGFNELLLFLLVDVPFVVKYIRVFCTHAAFDHSFFLSLFRSNWKHFHGKIYTGY